MPSEHIELTSDGELKEPDLIKVGNEFNFRNPLFYFDLVRFILKHKVFWQSLFIVLYITGMLGFYSRLDGRLILFLLAHLMISLYLVRP
jgi:hypothetical protein